MKIYHVVNYYEAKNEDEKKRNAFAARSWGKLYEKGVEAIHISDGQLSRSSKDLGDSRPVPYVKDIIEEAIKQIPDAHKGEAVLLLSNMDTILHEDIIGQIKPDSVFYGCRRELEEDVDDLLSLKEISQLRLAHESSADVFCFSVDWWNKHKHLYPDMLLGCQWWDTTMIDLMEAYKLQDDVRLTNYIYHRNHKPFWFSEETMFKNPGQQHNRTLAYNWDNPNKNTKFDDVKTWERHLKNKFNSNLGKHYVKVGKITYVF